MMIRGPAKYNIFLDNLFIYLSIYLFIYLFIYTSFYIDIYNKKRKTLDIFYLNLDNLDNFYLKLPLVLKIPRGMFFDSIN